MKSFLKFAGTAIVVALLTIGFQSMYGANITPTYVAVTFVGAGLFTLAFNYFTSSL